MAEQIPPPDKKSKWEEERRKKAIAEATDAEIVDTPQQSEKSESFDPHSVASLQTVEEQKKSQKIREILASSGAISPERVHEASIDINDVRVPQYKTNAKMQSDIDALQTGAGESKNVSLELEKLSPEERKLYQKLPKDKQESYLVHLAEVHAEKEKREKKRRTPAAPMQDDRLPEGESSPEISAAADAEPVESDTRIEPTLGGVVEPLEDISPIPDGSQDWRDGWKKKLWDTIKQFPKNVAGDIQAAGKGVAYVATNPLESLRAVRVGAERAIGYTKYFMDRDISFKERGEKLGMDLKALTENYNKLPFRQKAYITAAFIGGGAVAATAGLPTLSSLFAGGMYTQRVFGGAGFALNRRKVMESHEHWLAHRSDTIKNTYATVLGGAYLGVSAMAGRYATEKVTEWLGSVFGHDTGVGVGEVAPSPRASVPVPEAAPATPAVMIHASSGRGYEYMLKRMWDDLQERQLDPSKYGENSDIHKLLTADAGNIDKVVHDIASDPQHGFFNPDGTSAVIRPTDILTVGANGQVLLITPDDVIAHAPVGGPTTSAYHPPAVEQQAPLPDGIVPPDTSPAALEDQEAGTPLETSEAESPEAPPPLQEVNVVSPEPTRTVEVTTSDQDFAETPAASETLPPAPSSVPEIGPNGYINTHEVPINPDVTHGYLSGKDVYLFGGSGDLDTLAQEYVQKNNVSVFVDKSYTNWLGWTTHRVVEYAPTEGGPPAMIIHNGPSLVPDPKNFTKRLF